MKNEVIISGRLVSLEQDYSCTKGVIEVERNSGIIDKVPFVTEHKVNIYADWVHIKGKLKTRNERGKDGRNHKKHYILAERIIVNEDKENRNEVTIHGTIVHKDVLRETPKGKVIMDIIVAVNDGIGLGSQYPSCIVWGSVAENTECLPIGTDLLIEGRFRSREYMKKTEHGVQVRMAYEISVKNMVVL